MEPEAKIKELLQGDQESEVTTARLFIEGVTAELFLLHAEGMETISSLFMWELEVAAVAPGIPAAGTVGKEARLVIERAGGTREVNGILASLKRLGKRGRYLLYRLRVVPRAFRLLHKQDCRIFQGRTLPQVVGQVLTDGGVAHAFRLGGRDDPRPLTFCVQYRESDWAFVARRLEHAGLFFYDEQTSEGQRLAIGVDSRTCPDIPGKAELPFHPPDARVPASEQVSAFYLGEELTPGAVALTDFNLDQPSVALGVSAQTEQDPELLIFDFPGGHQSPAEGKSLAALRLEEQCQPRSMGGGRSTCPRLAVGHFFTLSGSNGHGFDGRYLVTRVRHRIEAAGQDLSAGALDHRCSYDNAFGCLPREVRYRPARITPRPAIRGLQTAEVVGPKRQEVYTDAQGRVKVRFRWDHRGKPDETASCWVPVAQAWAGPGRGALAIPRVGDEVLVEFLEGDPDHPVVTGSIYHGRNLPPATLPGQATRTTLRTASTPGGKGHNELTFEDLAGAEEVYLRAQKDLREEVGHDLTVKVAGNVNEAVQGQVRLQVGASRTLSVGAGQKLDVAADHQEEAGGTRTVKAKKVSIEAEDELRLTCGAASLAMTKDGTVTIEGAANVILRGRFIRLN